MSELPMASFPPLHALPAAAPGPGAPGVAQSSLSWAMADLEAGDRAAAQGGREEALALYGSVLDCFLGKGLYVMAASVAQRMIERFPDVVRARGALAVLSLAEGAEVLSPRVVRSARAEFDAYVDAARAAGRADEAAAQLHRMAEVTESPIVREWIADYLSALGDASGAEEVYLAAYEEREGLRPARPGGGDQRDRWARVLLPAAGL